MTKTLFEVMPEATWFKTNGYVLETKDKNGTGEVWKNVNTGEWIIVSKTSTWTTIFFPSTGEFRQYPVSWVKKGYEWTKSGVDMAIRAAFTQFPQWGTTFQIADSYEMGKDVWAVNWQKAGQTFTAYMKKDAVMTGDLAWIADQFAKSPVYA